MRRWAGDLSDGFEEYLFTSMYVYNVSRLERSPYM